MRTTGRLMTNARAMSGYGREHLFADGARKRTIGARVAADQRQVPASPTYAPSRPQPDCRERLVSGRPGSPISSEAVRRCLRQRCTRAPSSRHYVPEWRSRKGPGNGTVCLLRVKQGRCRSTLVRCHNAKLAEAFQTQFRRDRIARPITHSLSLLDRKPSSSVKWVTRCRYVALVKPLVRSLPQ